MTSEIKQMKNEFRHKICVHNSLELAIWLPMLKATGFRLYTLLYGVLDFGKTVNVDDDMEFDAFIFRNFFVMSSRKAWCSLKNARFWLFRCFFDKSRNFWNSSAWWSRDEMTALIWSCWDWFSVWYAAKIGKEYAKTQSQLS